MDSVKEIKRIFKLQSEPSNILRLRNSSLKERIEKIKRIENFISSDSNHQIIARCALQRLKKI
jgi:hypothetical protein